MITREQIAQLLKSISEAHYQIHSYGWGDVPDLLAREDVIYPFLMVTPSSSNYEEGYATHTYTISIADRVLKDKVNEVNVDSDTHQILLDILSQIDNLMYDDVDVVKGGTITPFFDNFRHEVTGHFAEVGIRVKFAYDSCAVPSDIVPLPLPPPFECADASYRVQYVNGTLIEQGTIVSGGSKTINVPNPSTCDPASYEVRDANGSVLYSGTIASGGSQNIVVTNSTVVVRKSDNTIISSVSVLAQGSANYQVADSVITLTDTSAATISTTNVKATDPATIVAPNGTLNVNKSDGALISGQVVKSGETKGYNVADSVAVIKDSANTTLKSENIKATESEDIVINDSSVENSDASYSVNVLAEGSLILPDSQINVNSVDSGDVVSVKTIDVNITDGVDPVTPTSVGLVGNTLTIEVPSGGSPFNPNALVFEITTNLTGSTNSNQFKIVVTGAGNNYSVLTSDGQTFTGQTGNLTITFPSEGIYTIEISGTIRPNYLSDLDKNKLIRILNWGNGVIINARAFEGMPRFDILATDTPPAITEVISRLFHSSPTMVYNSTINNWNISAINSISGMFFGCTAFNQPLNSWNTSGITGQGFCTTTVGLFSSCSSFNQPLNNWNTSGATHLFSMFSGASKFNQDISGWNVSNVTNFESMFENSTSFNQNISGWNVSSATNMSRIFVSCGINQNLGAWQLNTAGVNLSLIFRFSGMSTANYTDTIVGWANYVFNNTGTPNGVNMSTQTGRTFDTSRSGGANFANAGLARTYLINIALWTISGDTVI
jgi:surface protein